MSDLVQIHRINPGGYEGTVPFRDWGGSVLELSLWMPQARRYCTGLDKVIIVPYTMGQACQPSLILIGPSPSCPGTVYWVWELCQVGRKISGMRMPAMEPLESVRCHYHSSTYSSTTVPSYCSGGRKIMILVRLGVGMLVQCRGASEHNPFKA